MNAAVSTAPACESCQQAPATITWSHPGAGAPFALCRRCAPAEAVAANAAGGER